MSRHQASINRKTSSVAAQRIQYEVVTKRLQCWACQRRFKKAEHLERHERSHLKQKPFTCLTCAKSFGRKDVLSRHEKLHDSGHKSTGNAAAQALGSHVVGNTGAAAVAKEIYFSTAKEDGTERSHNTPLNQSSPSTASISQSDVLPPFQPWIESDDLMQMFISDFNTLLPMSLPLPVMSIQPSNAIPGSSIPYQSVTIDQSQVPPAATGPGHQAMDQMSRLIAELSSNLTVEIRSKGITSTFLDTCVHAFFDRFVPSFPILNRAVLNFRDTSHPLLLNIMALGSLFIGASDAIPKGESLWKLAHVAVTTNWPKLMETKAPEDSCKGVQLVLTALTGQAYALLSQNEMIRSTAQIFHSLGFSWAKHCGMYDSEEVTKALPPIDASDAEKLEAWKVWLAGEVQKRAVLGHYILDGHISHFSGYSSCARHTTNPLTLPASDDAFRATNADEWIREMRKSSSVGLSFRDTFVTLFAKVSIAKISFSNFAIRVILEGLQSLVSDFHEAKGSAIGTPSKAEISQTLLRLYTGHFSLQDKHSIENMELLIRWHSICLDLSTPTTKLCRNLCAFFQVKQRLHNGMHQADFDFDLTRWTQTPGARRALLHSAVIHEISERLPLGRSHALHLPGAVFAASTVYTGFCLAGITKVSYPRQFRWEDALSYEATGLLDSVGSDTSFNVINAFLQGRYSIGGPDSTSRDLMYDLNSLQVIIKSLSRWGVSRQMETILQRWITTATQEK